MHRKKIKGKRKRLRRGTNGGTLAIRDGLREHGVVENQLKGINE